MTAAHLDLGSEQAPYYLVINSTKWMKEHRKNGRREYGKIKKQPVAMILRDGTRVQKESIREMADYLNLTARYMRVVVLSPDWTYINGVEMRFTKG